MFRAHIFSLFIQTSLSPRLSSFPVTQCVSPLPVWWLWWTRRKRRTWGNSTAPTNTAPRTCVPRKQGRCVVSWLLTNEAWRRWNNSAKRDCTLCDATPSRHRPAVWNKVKKWRIWLLSVCVCVVVVVSGSALLCKLFGDGPFFYTVTNHTIWALIKPVSDLFCDRSPLTCHWNNCSKPVNKPWQSYRPESDQLLNESIYKGVGAWKTSHNKGVN